MYFAFVGREDRLYTYTGVGLSALLVSTYRAMREPTDCGTSDRMALRFFLCINNNNPNNPAGAYRFYSFCI